MTPVTLNSESGARPLISLRGQVAIVTGARRGLGRSYAHELAGRGAAVVVNGTPESGGLDELVAEIAAAGGIAVASPRDITTRDGGRAVVDDALKAFGAIHILVNNAGILRTDFFENLTDAKIDDVFDIHLNSLFYVTQPTFAVMREAGYGRIINTSSNTAFGMSGLASYGAAKAGVIGFTKCLALEASEHGIGVNCILPNATTPAMANDPIPGFENDTRFGAAFTAVSDRFGTDLVAPMVAFLASRDCTLSGEALSALGGRYARVFFGVTEGWLAPSGVITADDIAANISQITDPSNHFIVDAIIDEYEAVAVQIAASQPTVEGAEK